MTNFLELIGKVDNLHEEKPALNNKSVLLGIVISFLILALICAFLRLGCRIFLVKAAGWDDFFVVLVMISISIGSIGVCIATDHGLGEHLLNLGLPKLALFLKTFYVCNTTLPMSTTFIKIAILLQYLRTFDRGTKSRAVTLVMIVITSTWGVAYIFLAWVPCVPVAAYWDWSIKTDRRWGFGSQSAEELVRTYETHATTNMILDIIIFAIPLPLYFNNDTSQRSRKSVLGLFLLGSVVLMLSAWRLIAIVRSRAGTYPTFDPTWYGPAPMVLALLEIDVAAICASLPVFWPMLQSEMGRIFVTHEVKVTVVSVDDESRGGSGSGSGSGIGRIGIIGIGGGGTGGCCYDDDVELAGGAAFSCAPLSPIANKQDYPHDAADEPEIFGAYMGGKTTAVTKVG